MPGVSGAIRLFRFSGIDVFLHWSWFLVAAYEVQRMERYSSIWWSILQYVAIFGIVLLHEFGHALACRQVGGRALQIVLWPIGGVAYVDPPQRPGATLWSIAAGPLVNVALIPVFAVPLIATSLGSSAPGDFALFIREMNAINLGLLIFNVLPIYPLDGGQILRSILWFIVGRARSLMAAVVVGFVGVAGLALIAVLASDSSLVLGIIAVFAGIQCYSGYRQAKFLRHLEEAPRQPDYACPSCQAHPPIGPYWGCPSCRIGFDTFYTEGQCPRCRSVYSMTQCLDCGANSPFAQWTAAPSRAEGAGTY